jgi:Zn-dependent M16 (insulinase) family peptidase
MQKQEFRKNEEYCGFVVDGVTAIEEVDLLVYELSHKPSGAEVIHIASNEIENLFSICFKTYPNHNKGVAHILEHTVLCGSRRYPVKDPFFSMNRRSLTTFMNALTGNNFTAYPAATTNQKDFYNLLDVYIDAVFFPILQKESFYQEGFRLELTNSNNLMSPVCIKGIVFNEMRGALSRTETRLWRDVLKTMFPNHPHGYNAGGDPVEIITLTYQELIEYHKQYYSPSRATFFFNGSIPLKTHLDFIYEKVLKGAEKLPSIPPVELIKRFQEPKRTISYYPSQEKDLNKKTFVVFGWLTTDITDLETLIALSLLDSILMDTDASLLKNTLLGSDLCLQADSVLDTEMREIPYFILCHGCNVENINELEKILFKRLKEISREKIDNKLIEASMYQMEFERLEINGEQYPYGLELFYRTVISKQQGGSVVPHLQIHELFEKMAVLFGDPDYFSNIIEKFFLSNSHYIRHVMEPDLNIHAREETEINNILSEKSRQLTQKEREDLVEEMKKFNFYQNQKENNIDCLPKLRLSNIPVNIQHYPLQRSYIDQLTIYYHPCNTNKIVYASLSFDIPQIEDDYLQYLYLFSSCLTEIGTGGKDYLETLDSVQATLGGIYSSISLNIQAQDTTNCSPTFTIHAKALERKIPDMFTHMKDLILTADFSDRERIKELIMQEYTDLEQKINRGAISYAIYRSKSGLSPFSYILNQWYGLPYFIFIRSLASNIDKMVDLIIERLEYIKRTVFHLNSPTLVLSCDEKAYKIIEQNHWFGLSKFSTNPYRPWIDFPLAPPVYTAANTMPIPVASNALAFESVPYLHQNSAPLNLAAILFENIVLHKELREEKGAYGCGAENADITGLFHFYSVRDPQIFSTYQSFKNSLEVIANGFFSEEDLEEAKLSFFQEADIPISPGMRARSTYSFEKCGLDQSTRQKYREAILSSTKQEVMNAVKESLLPKVDKGIWTSFASESLIEKENKLFEKHSLSPLPIEPI